MDNDILPLVPIYGPYLTLHETHISRQVNQDETITNTIQVRNSGQRDLNVTVSSDQPWLSIDSENQTMTIKPFSVVSIPYSLHFSGRSVKKTFRGALRLVSNSIIRPSIEITVEAQLITLPPVALVGSLDTIKFENVLPNEEVSCHFVVSREDRQSMLARIDSDTAWISVVELPGETGGFEIRARIGPEERRCEGTITVRGDKGNLTPLTIPVVITRAPRPRCVIVVEAQDKPKLAWWGVSPPKVPVKSGTPTLEFYPTMKGLQETHWIRISNDGEVNLTGQAALRTAHSMLSISRDKFDIPPGGYQYLWVTLRIPYRNDRQWAGSDEELYLQTNAGDSKIVVQGRLRYDWKPAEPKRRLFATLIDHSILLGIALALYLVVLFTMGEYGLYRLHSYALLLLLLHPFYFIYFSTRYLQTPGKKYMGIEVWRLGANRPANYLGLVILRYIVGVFTFPWYLGIVLGRKIRGPHDIATDTVVKSVYEKP